MKGISVSVSEQLQDSVVARLLERKEETSWDSLFENHPRIFMFLSSFIAPIVVLACVIGATCAIMTPIAWILGW